MTGFMEKYAYTLAVCILQHLYYVLVSVGIAAAVGIFFGILLSRVPKISGIVMPFLGIFQTIPGIVFIGILLMYVGMNQLSVLIALSIYAVFPILKNTYAGLICIEHSYIEVATGLGMNKKQILFQVEIPLALPSIFAGVRMSLIYTVSWAVLAAMIGQGGLGQFIYIGIDANVREYIIIGSVPIAVLAVILRKCIDRVEEKVVSKGVKRDESIR